MLILSFAMWFVWLCHESGWWNQPSSLGFSFLIHTVGEGVWTGGYLSSLWPWHLTILCGIWVSVASGVLWHVMSDYSCEGEVVLHKLFLFFLILENGLGQDLFRKLPKPLGASSFSFDLFLICFGSTKPANSGYSRGCPHRLGAAGAASRMVLRLHPALGPCTGSPWPGGVSSFSGTL